MGKFAVCAVATIALASVAAIAPASAEYSAGPLVQNGQCWKAQVGSANPGTWGYWGACPQTAGATATSATATRVHHRKHPAHS